MSLASPQRERQVYAIVLVVVADDERGRPVGSPYPVIERDQGDEDRLIDLDQRIIQARHA